MAAQVSAAVVEFLTRKLPLHVWDTPVWVHNDSRWTDTVARDAGGATVWTVTRTPV
jgi:hypothetical protein